ERARVPSARVVHREQQGAAVGRPGPRTLPGPVSDEQFPAATFRRHFLYALDVAKRQMRTVGRPPWIEIVLVCRHTTLRAALGVVYPDVRPTRVVVDRDGHASAVRRESWQAKRQ